MRRLSRAGFKQDFVRSAILPDWWDTACEQDARMLPDIEIRVARFMGLPILAVRDPRVPVTPATYDGAQLRCVRDLARERLAPAIHAAMQIAAAVVRNLRVSAKNVTLPPVDALTWRTRLRSDREAVTLGTILDDLWGRGIPVIALDVLPSPGFQGAACIVEDRPVIVLGQRHDEPGRVAFLVAHEVAHITSGACAIDRPVVDEAQEIPDTAEIERAADGFATRLLSGADSFPSLRASDHRELAKKAAELRRKTGADPGGTIFAWASETRDFGMATRAVQALYLASGARRQLRQRFEQHIDVDAASETDRNLLRCVYGESGADAAAV